MRIRSFGSGAKTDTRTLRWMRSLTNLYFQDEIDFEALDLPPVVECPFDEPDIPIAKRLTEAFCRAMDHGADKGSGIWERISRQHHSAFMKALLDRDHESVASELTRMFRSGVMFGMSSALDDFQSRVRLLDAVASLGVAAGLIPLRTPMHLATKPLLHADWNGILEEFTALAGHDLAPPQCGGIYGLEFRGKALPLRHIFQLQQAHSLKLMLGRDGTGRGCIEIGGGVGFLAQTCMQAGLFREYCLVDLPQVNVLQGYFLLKSDLADRVELFGESSADAAPDAPRIRILPNVATDCIADKSLAVAVNVDSMPEMSTEVIAGYLDEIRRTCTDCFISNNKEVPVPDAGGFTHGWVHRLARDNPGLELRRRTPWWMREGYVEEVYVIRD